MGHPGDVLTAQDGGRGAGRLPQLGHHLVLAGQDAEHAAARHAITGHGAAGPAITGHGDHQARHHRVRGRRARHR